MAAATSRIARHGSPPAIGMDGEAVNHGVRPGIDHTRPRCFGIVTRLDHQDADRSVCSRCMLPARTFDGVNSVCCCRTRVKRSDSRAIGGELHRSADAGDVAGPHVHQQKRRGGTKTCDRPSGRAERDPVLDGRDAVRRLDPEQNPGRDDRPDQAPAQGHALSMITFRGRRAFQWLGTAPARASASPGGHSRKWTDDVL